MSRMLFLLMLGLFFVRSKAQNNFEYYKVYELNISDWNKLETNENFDFGYNYAVDSVKSIGLGYYLWIENTWYKVVNDNEVFNVENKSPLYFKIDKNLNNDLQIKDSIGTVYTYSLESLEPFIISKLLYDTNLDVIKNITDAEVVSSDLIGNNMNFEENESVSVLKNDIYNIADFVSSDFVSLNDVNLANADAMLFSVDGIPQNDTVLIEYDSLMFERNVEVVDIVSKNKEKPKLLTGFFIAPNIKLPTSARKGRILDFDLYKYYENHFSNAIISSSLLSSELKLFNSDFEYQVTFFNSEEIEILEITNLGILKYKIIKSNSEKFSNINIRYLMK